MSQWKDRFAQAWIRAEKVLDDAAEECHLAQMMSVLALSNVFEVVSWFAEFCQQPMSFPVLLLLFGEPIHLLVSVLALVTATIIDLACCYVVAGTEFGAAAFTYGVTMSSLLSWGLKPPELPHRHTNREAKKQRSSSTDEPFLDQDEESEEPYASMCEKYKRACQPTMLWDLKVADQDHKPTAFEMFIRFLLVLKGGLDLIGEESNPLVAWQLIMYSLSGDMNRNSEDHQYDADSVLIAIDNCSSRCITNSMKDFIEDPVRVNVKVQGIGGSVTATYRGTVPWSIEDDNGRVHHFVIPHTYYNPSTPYRLLSPQHWARVASDNSPNKRGTWCATYEDAVELFWSQRQFKRVIPLSASNNIALVRSAPSFSKLHSFCMEIAPALEGNCSVDETELLSCPAASITDDDGITERDRSIFRRRSRMLSGWDAT
ncbi:unknown protein [Seminavis robusta]|uniref:Uncharacterized protein n=1 Tax=Seminavis robusta TaxID=568900 RepID=A0A9N8EWU8_9STRA|nr:unknown protein [Seminavis robusta]|eukprot:Sro2175_g317760.1 n/a (429) ;mRNA; r:8350-9867